MAKITKELMESFFEKRSVRVLAKVFLGLLAVSLSGLFFGLCVPFFLLAMGILPRIGTAGVVYVMGGGAFGVLLGGIFSAVSFAKSPKWLPRSYLIFTIGLAVAILVYWVCYLNIEMLQRNL